MAANPKAIPALTKHTPGPWHVTAGAGDANMPDGCTVGIDDAFGVDGGRDYYLATVVHGDPDELRANAALVAAAPDLLAALRDVLADLGPDCYTKAVQRAQVAIAKAEGRS